MSKINDVRRHGVSTRTPVQVLLTEGFATARKELCELLSGQGFEMVAEVTDNWNAVRLTKQFRPDVAILDAASKFVESLKAVKEILSWNQKAKIILLSLHAESQYAMVALQSGVRGYVLKTRAAADLDQAINEVSKGGIYLSSGVSPPTVARYALGNE
jgi:two-component system, NarL family, invasion response regulator UvrY